MSNSLAEVGNSIRVENGFAFSSRFFCGSEQGLPLVRIRDIDARTTEVNFSGPFHPKYLLSDGDVIIGMDGDFRVSRWQGGLALLNQRVCRVTADQKRLDQDFLFHALQPHLDRVHRSTPQTTVRHLSERGIRSLKIPHFSLGEQRKIGEILDAMDEQIRSTSRVIAKLELVKEASLTHLLSQINPDLGSFGSVCESSAFGPRFSSDNYGEFGELAMLRTTDLDQEGNMRLHTMPRIALSPASFLSHLLIPKDLLISRSGTCGIASVFPGYEVPVIPGAFLIRFRLHVPDLSTFYRRYFNSSLGRPFLDRLAVGGVQKNLKGSEILRMLVPIPSLADVVKIEDAMTGIEDDIANEKGVLEKIRIMKQGLQADLLMGQVRVPAEVSS